MTLYNHCLWYTYTKLKTQYYVDDNKIVHIDIELNCHNSNIIYEHSYFSVVESTIQQ